MVCLPCDFKILLTVFNQSYNCQTSHYLGRNLLPKVFLMLPSLLRTNSKNLQFSNHGPILDFLMYCLKIQLIFGLTLYELKCPPYDLCGTCMPSGKDLPPSIYPTASTADVYPHMAAESPNGPTPFDCKVSGSSAGSSGIPT